MHTTMLIVSLSLLDHVFLRDIHEMQCVDVSMGIYCSFFDKSWHAVLLSVSMNLCVHLVIDAIDPCSEIFVCL